MAKVRGRDTGPEIQIRRLLQEAGVRYRLYPKLPGSPDVVLPQIQVVIFVDGCFWHGCPRHYSAPDTNADYWAKKMIDNRARDRRVSAQLRALGWTVRRVWECNLSERRDSVKHMIDGILKQSPRVRNRSSIRQRGLLMARIQPRMQGHRRPSKAKI